MSGIMITGGRRLSGSVSLHGAKNSVLPVLAATALCKGESVIHNCPDLSDVGAAIRILEHLGATVKQENGTVIVGTDNIKHSDIPDDLMREMRSSIVFLGAIAARTGRAKLSSPGGCELGPRPIDLHLSSLRDLGLQINEDHGYLDCSCPNGFIGCDITLAFPSVGATENIILAAVTAKGTTHIHNAAREPEISDLADFLSAAGAKILGAGSGVIEIIGVDALHGIEHSVIPDRIEAATYLAAIAVTGGKAELNHVLPSHLAPVMGVFKSAGCELYSQNNTVVISAPKQLHRVPMIRTMPYPGFPTDAGPPVIAMLSLADGTSMFVENIFENRFKIVDELKRLGAMIHTTGRVAVIEGVTDLSGARVECTDLRGGAALVVAALAARGVTDITKIGHIDRGYEGLTENLSALGAEIKRS